MENPADPSCLYLRFAPCIFNLICIQFAAARLDERKGIKTHGKDFLSRFLKLHNENPEEFTTNDILIGVGGVV